MESKTPNQVHADYYTVIPQINYYYYSMLDYYRVYLEMRLNGKENKKMMTRLQGIMVVLYDLFKHYDSIHKNNTEQIFYGTEKLAMLEVFSKFETMCFVSTKRMNFKGLTAMKDALVKCYHLLGLSDIEKNKQAFFMDPIEKWNINP